MPSACRCGESDFLEKRKALEKAELHSGCCEQEFALQNGQATPKSQVWRHRQKNYNKCAQPHRKAYHAGCTDGNEKLKYGQIPLWRSLVQWLGDWKRPVLKESTGKNALRGEMKVNKAEYMPALGTEAALFRDAVCSHWWLFPAAHSRLQQNYCLCFLAVKAGPSLYSNQYWRHTYSQFYSLMAETGGSQ